MSVQGDVGVTRLLVQWTEGNKQAMEQALQKCEAYATANCSPGSDGRNVCLKTRTKQCMQGEGWTEN